MTRSKEDHGCLFEQSSDAIMVTDFEGNFKDVNQKLCSIFGFTKEELLQKNVRELIDKNHLHASPLRFDLLADGEHIFNERKMVRRDGTMIFVEANAKKCGADRIVCIARDITERKKAELILQKSEQQLLNQKLQEQKKITRAVLNAQEIERNRIGQELHDNVNQLLVSARLYLDVVVNDQIDKKDILEKSAQLIDEAIQEIRILSREHVSPQIKSELRELIESLVQDLNEHCRSCTRFSCRIAEDVFIEEELKLNIYRIVQEQLNNIIKHAAAKNAMITLDTKEGSIVLCVVDDGKGFNALKSRKGIGITNMLNRVESFNGEVRIDTAPGKGCSITIRIPQ